MAEGAHPFDRLRAAGALPVVLPLITPLTPAEALPRLCRGDRPFLLDGGGVKPPDGDGEGRYSFGGCDPVALLRDRGEDPPPPPPTPGQRRTPAAPLLRLQQALGRYATHFCVGLLGYDLGRCIERLPPLGRIDDLGVPAIDFAAYEAVYRHDARTGRGEILACDEAAAIRLARRLGSEAAALPPPQVGAARFETEESDYRRRVRRVLEHLRAGDCYQVNLCHRLRASVDGPLALYLRLRAESPAPLGAYVELAPKLALLANSPELFLRYDLDGLDGQDGGGLETRPIKGTRRRGRDAEEDQALAVALRASAKDAAEHLMIVDLLRNDLGRVSAAGTVRADETPRCVALPTVHHLISTVRGVPAAGIGLADVLTALLPGGSITGAPKVRAMAIIDELEPVRRGPFYGAVGWLGPRQGQLALCIRTAIVRARELTLAVGGGVVLDSTPEDELLETRVKAAAFLRVLGAA